MEAIRDPAINDHLRASVTIVLTCERTNEDRAICKTAGRIIAELPPCTELSLEEMRLEDSKGVAIPRKKA